MARNNRGRGGKFRKDKEFDQQLVDVARVTRIVAGGRRFRFRAVVVIGNRKGLVGMGVGKGGDVSIAIDKAVTEAKKHLVKVPIVNNTIPHEIWVDYGSAKVFLKPADAGTGVIAGGAVRAVMDLAGVKNVLSKMYGSSNKLNNVRATITAFERLKKSDEFAALRGKDVEELIGKKGKIINEKGGKEKKRNTENTENTGGTESAEGTEDDKNIEDEKKIQQKIKK